MRRLALIVIGVLWAGMTLWAAGQPEEGQPGSERPVLEFGLSGNPDTLDPHKTSGTLTFQVIRSVYDTLVEPGRDGRIQPALAREWSVSEDQTVWTFELRQGVTFHNGSAFDAGDVKATLERVMAEETGSPLASEYEAIETIRTPDEHTVVLELSEPFAPLLATLASGWSAILPEELIEEGHDFGNRPVGTGPFVFEQWTRDTRIKLSRNERYWMEDLPKIGGVNFNIITEGAVQRQGLLSGELHIIDTVNQQDRSVIASNDGTKLDSHLSSLVLVLAMNTDRAPFDNVTVRRAVNHAVDKQSVLDVAYGGGQVVATFMDYTDPFYVDFTDLYPYDPEQAQQMFRQAGVNGEQAIDLVAPQNYEAHVAAAEVYQEMLEEAGLNVQIRQVDWSTWLSEVYRGGSYDLTVIGHTGKLDPHGRLSPYMNDENYVGFSTERLSELLARGQRMVSFDERQALYADALEIFARRVPHLYLGSPEIFYGVRENVSGFHVDANLDTFDFRRVEIE